MADNAKPGILRNLRVKRVALVEAGANFDIRTGDGAHIVLHKAAGPAAAKVHVHPIDTTKESGVTKAKKTVQDVVKSLVAAFAEPDAEKRAELIKASEEMAGEVGKDIPPAAAPGAGATPPPTEHVKAAHEAMGKAIAAFGPGPHPDGHPIHAMKAAHEAMGKACVTDEPGALGDGGVSKAITALEKSNKELAAQLVVEKGIRLDREMIDILKSFKATPFVLEGADSDIASFRKMKESDPEGFERMIAKMRATDEQLAASAVYKNIGSGRTGTGSAYDQLKAKADAMISKSAKPLTFAKAFEEVCSADPKLVAEYRAQQQ